LGAHIANSMACVMNEEVKVHQVNSLYEYGSAYYNVSRVQQWNTP
jgi:hypothetical protein